MPYGALGQVHEAFASSRSSDFVYVPGDEAHYHRLDQHAETIEGDVRDPYVVLGPPGSGKSALLANWVERRRQTKHRDEFLFQHFVGCSPRSKQLSHLLFRLETALKEFFGLREMEVPKSEERLRWSLSRFLYSAAKKQTPARIVIVLDGVDKLLGETASADSLHWLPTQLEPGVRFILSTTEYEKYGVNGAHPLDGSRLQRTWMELMRRRCPYLRVEPLTMDVRHSIIEAFLDKSNREAQGALRPPGSPDMRGDLDRKASSSSLVGDHGRLGSPAGWMGSGPDGAPGEFQPLLDLNSANRFKIATAKPSSQPMFLRTILYALRLGVEMSDVSLDEQIEIYLSAESPDTLISQVFDLCSDYVDAGDSVAPSILREDSQESTREEPDRQNILGRVLSVLYASRHGLSEEEIWGSVEMGLGTSLREGSKTLILRILADITMTVDGLRMFSHEEYRSAVYDKYIQAPDLHIRLHLLMARYFGRLEPCDRKLDSLPYHLEVSGSWGKLKNALVGVDMFRLWWTPKHKSEFISLWASLTDRNNPRMPMRKLVTGEFDATMRCSQAPRPCFDIVEEYVRSCDEFKFAAQPSHEELADVVLKIADFMLEFATLGLEQSADVPQFIHPAVPNQDLEALGVPYLDTHEEGLSVLKTPVISGNASGVKPSIDAPAKLNEEIPVCSTYFFHRWMWIQFPLIALANCGKNYEKGIEYASSLKRGYRNSNTSGPDKLAKVKGAKTIAPRTNNPAGTHNPSMAKLPSIGVPNKKYISRTHTIPQAKPGDVEVNEEFIEKQFADTEKQVRFDIEDRRRHLDHLRDRRVALERAKQRLIDESRDLEKMHFGSTELERKRDGIGQHISDTDDGIQREKQLHTNYMAVHAMCKRHPAESAALIEELEKKLKVDAAFIDQAKSFKKYMENTVKARTLAQNSQLSAESTKSRRSRTKHSRGERKSNAVDVLAQQKLQETWEDWQHIIHQRTGISDPATFFSRFESSAGLERQMSSMRRAAEKRQRELKEMVVKVEKDLEEARYEAQAAGMQSGEVRDAQNKLTKNTRDFQHLKERTDQADRLAQGALSGLKHVCETLGMPPIDRDTQIADIINSIDELLDALLEEKDRAQQKSQQSASSGSLAIRDIQKSETSIRASELNAALNQYQTPKQLVAARLLGRVKEENEEPEKHSDPIPEESARLRKDIKSASHKTLKAEQRRQARERSLEQQAAVRAQE